MARTKQSNRAPKQRRTKKISSEQGAAGKRALGPGKMAAGPGPGKGFSGYARFASATRDEQSAKAQAAARHFLGHSPSTSPAESPLQSPVKSARVRWTLVPVGESRPSRSGCRSRRHSTDTRTRQQPTYNRARAQSENLKDSQNASASKENIRPLPNRNWSRTKSEEKPAALQESRTVKNKNVVRALFQLKADVKEFVPQCEGTPGPLVSERTELTTPMLKADVPEFVPQCQKPRVFKKKDKEYLYDPMIAQQIKQRKKEKKKAKKMKKQLEELEEKKNLLQLAMTWPTEAGVPPAVAMSLRDTEHKMRSLHQQQQRLATSTNVKLAV